VLVLLSAAVNLNAVARVLPGLLGRGERSSSVSRTTTTTSMSDDRVAELKGAYNSSTFYCTHSYLLFFSARLAARDAHVRESWVRAMEARIVRDQLQSCYRTEGVNHYETCRELSEKYITLLRENRVRLRFSHLVA
jgi:hypothetical protein